jgi:hypothetical protein
MQAQGVCYVSFYTAKCQDGIKIGENSLFYSLAKLIFINHAIIRRYLQLKATLKTQPNNRNNETL